MTGARLVEWGWGMERGGRVSWFEPYGVTARRSWGELRQTGMARAVVWGRIVVVAAALVGVFIMVLVRMYPGIVLPWPQIVWGLVLGPAMVAVALAAHTFAPCHVQVRGEWVQISLGQFAHRIARERVIGVEIVDPDAATEAGSRLLVKYAKRNGKEGEVDVAVSRRVDRGALERALIELREGLAEKR